MKPDEIYTYSAFNGNAIHHAEVGRQIGKWSVSIAVKPGTYQGHSTLALSILCDSPVTSELVPTTAVATECRSRSVNRRNIRLIQQSSLEALADAHYASNQRRALYFLDAPWNDYYSLPDKLKAISDVQGPKPVIVVHGFQVPGQIDLGSDTYKDIVLNLDYVSNTLDRIYHGQIGFHYNALVAGRGVLYVEPER